MCDSFINTNPKEKKFLNNKNDNKICVFCRRHYFFWSL